MKKIFQFFLLLIANNLIAQESCNDDLIMAVKGKWTNRQDAKSVGQGQAASRIDKMQQLLREAYPQPMGIEAAWYHSMGGHYPSIHKSAASYQLNALFKTYYCNTHIKKMQLGTETGNWFYVWVNKFSWFAQVDDKFLVENKPVYLLTKKLGELNGFPLHAGIDNRTSNTGTTFSKTILISRPGQLPYTAVSRKQYLQVLIKNKEDWQKSYVESLLKVPVRSDSEEEVYKKQQMEIVVNREQNEQAKEKARANFLRGYTTQKQRKQDDISLVEKVYEQDIRAAQDYLANNTDEELAMPAILNNNSYSGSFTAFAKENEGMMMVQVNNAYFNNKLSAHVPQFLVVYWSWNTEKPSIDFADHIENNFDFKALQAMLDK